MQLRDYQQTARDDVAAAWRNGLTNVLAVMPTGAGKCLGRDTPVLLWTGEVKAVQDIKVDDLLMGPDSAPRRVVSLARGQEEMYRIVPKKGDPFVVNKSHVMSFMMTFSRASFEGHKGGSIVNMPLADYLSRTKTFKHGAKIWRTGVNFPEQATPLPLDPWFLGAWLGDGTSRSPSITTGDPEIVSALENYAKSIGMVIRKEPNSENSIVVHINTGVKGLGRGIKHNLLKNVMEHMGLLKNKHVPFQYKTASRKDRLELLAGIIDTDGFWSGKGYELILKNKQLLEDVVFIARSLGFSAYPYETQKTCGNNGKTGTYWRCSINGPVETVPCRIPRKQAPPRLQKKNPLVSGFSVEPLGEGDYYGFEISGNDRLFLLGDFTVTHNTVLFGTILRDESGPAIAIAHRQELVGQMSTTLAKQQVRHRIIAPTNVIRDVVSIHMREFGASYYDPNSRVAVAGVDTLIRRDREPWMNDIGLWVCDEGHHLVRGNKWHTATTMFPNARGLGVTATPLRADGKGLGRSADGVFDILVEGPQMRALIEQGFLTEYRIFAPPSDLNLADVPMSDATGDYNAPALREAAAKSRIVGDAVESYLRIARGKLGVTFCVSVDLAAQTAARYREAGVPAEMLSAKTPDVVRAATLRKFRNREILQICNVDLFGEGFDLPALEVVSMARPTMSYGLYAQQFGRALRPMDGKDAAIIIDHAGNVIRHGVPDAPRVWSLGRRPKRARSDNTPPTMRVCPECTGVYERIRVCCPYCGHEPVPAVRTSPQLVEGDLYELDPAVLARLRGQAARIDDLPLIPHGATREVRNAIIKRHREKQVAQSALRETIAWWAGWQKSLGRSDRESYRRFYAEFGVDVATAQTLGTTDAADLRGRIGQALAGAGIRGVAA